MAEQKRSILTAAREARARPKPVPDVPKAAQKPNPKPVFTDETVPAACGHPIAVPSLKPLFRENWLKKHTGRPCAECRAMAHAELLAREAANRKARGPKKERKMVASGRLPDGAMFHMTYDAQAVLWHGVLSIPGEEAPCHGQGSGLELVQRKLYRQWLADQPAVPLTEVP